MPKGMTDIRVSATASVTGYSGGTYTQAERKTSNCQYLWMKIV